MKTDFLKGHDALTVERYPNGTRHMKVFDVLSDDSPVGFRGKPLRLYLSEEGYQRALAVQRQAQYQNHATRPRY